MTDYQRAIRNEIDYWPGARVQFSQRSKHAEATLFNGEQSRFVVYPLTPSDSRRGLANCIGDVRRELHALGLHRLERKPRVRKRANKVIGTRRLVAPILPHVGKAPVRGNPFDVLADVKIAPPAPVPPKQGWLARLLAMVLWRKK